MNFVELAERNLSNNFNGKGSSMNVLTATANNFGVNISNTGSSPVNIALIPGHYRTLGMLGGVPHWHDLTEINKAGVAVQAIMDDGSQDLAGGNTITCNPTDPTYSIRSFLEYINTFDMSLARIDLRNPGGNVEVFTNKIKFSRSNPFFRTEEIPVRTNQFFRTDQYQDNRIEISMAGTDAVLTKDLVVIVTIPPNTILGVDFYFFN